MSRERAPFRDDIDLEDSRDRTWRHSARACDAALAQPYALSDELGKIDDDLEPSICGAVRPEPLFVNDILRCTEETADRIKSDHAMFREDRADRTFTRIDIEYR